MDQSSPAARVATGRDWQRSVSFFLILAVLTVPFLLLLLLVTDKWGPLAAADQGARDALHVFALGQPWFVGVMRTFSDSGSSLAWQIVTVIVTLMLLLRRRWRLAAFTVVTIAASSLLNTAVKHLGDRQRPLVDQPFVNEPGASFPSGHAQAAVVGYGVPPAAAARVEPDLATSRRPRGRAHDHRHRILPGGVGRPFRL